MIKNSKKKLNQTSRISSVLLLLVISIMSNTVAAPEVAAVSAGPPVEPTLPGAILSGNVTADRNSLSAGDAVKYTVEISNTGNQDTPEYAHTFIDLPPWMALDTDVLNVPALQCNETGQVRQPPADSSGHGVDCRIRAIGQGETKSLSFMAAVVANPADFGYVSGDTADVKVHLETLGVSDQYYRPTVSVTCLNDDCHPELFTPFDETLTTISTQLEFVSAVPVTQGTPHYDNKFNLTIENTGADPTTGSLQVGFKNQTPKRQYGSFPTIYDEIFLNGSPGGWPFDRSQEPYHNCDIVDPSYNLDLICFIKDAVIQPGESITIPFTFYPMYTPVDENINIELQRIGVGGSQCSFLDETINNGCGADMVVPTVMPGQTQVTGITANSPQPTAPGDTASYNLELTNQSSTGKIFGGKQGGASFDIAVDLPGNKSSYIKNIRFGSPRPPNDPQGKGKRYTCGFEGCANNEFFTIKIFDPAQSMTLPFNVELQPWIVVQEVPMRIGNLSGPNCDVDNSVPCYYDVVIDVDTAANQTTLELIVDGPSGHGSFDFYGNPGESTEYTFTAINRGNETSQNTIITQDITQDNYMNNPDEYLDVLTIESDECSIVEGLVTCNLGDMAPGEEKTVSVKVAYKEFGEFDYNEPNLWNLIFHGAVELISDNSNCVASDPICSERIGYAFLIPDASLKVHKEASKSNPQPGEEFDWIITIYNDSNNPALKPHIFDEGYGWKYTDEFYDDDNICYMYHSASTGWTELDCDLPDAIGPHSSYTFTIPAIAIDPDQINHNKDKFNNSVEISASNFSCEGSSPTALKMGMSKGDAPSDPSGLLCGYFTSIRRGETDPQLKLTKTVDNDELENGDEFIWSVEIENLTDESIFSIDLNDVFPEGETWLEIMADAEDLPYGCEFTGFTPFGELKPINCFINSLDANDSIAFDFPMKVGSKTQAGSYTNTANIVTSGGVCDPSNGGGGPFDPGSSGGESAALGAMSQDVVNGGKSYIQGDQTYIDNCTDSSTVHVTSSASPDLLVRKEASVNSVEPGDEFNWIISVTNRGDADAVNAVVTDIIEEGMTIVSTPLDCNATGNDIECEIDDLGIAGENNDSVSFVFRVKVDDPLPASVKTAGELVNTAYVYEENSCPEPSVNPDCNSTTTVPLTPTPELAISKSSDVPSVDPGEEFTWSVIVTNNGQGDATNTVVTDTLPEGTAFVSGASGCDVDGQEITCDVGDLASGDSVTFDILVVADDPIPAAVLAAGEVINTAQVTDDDSCPLNDPCITTHIVEITPRADLSILKTSSASSVKPGESFDWTITVTNNGQGDDTGVIITDTLPDGTTPGTAPNDCIITGQDMECDIGDLASGDTISKTVTVTVDDPLPPEVLDAGAVINTATVTDENGNCPEDDPCDSTSIVYTNPVAELDIVKTSSAPPVRPGESFDWTITVTNNGQGDATNVVITDTLPDGTTPSGAAPNDCTLVGNDLTCNIGDLSIGDSITKTVTVTADDPVPASVLAAGEVINTAKVTSENSNCPPDSDNPDCITTHIVEITPSADLTIQKTSSAPAVKPGESFDWSITVTNKGQGTAENVVITDVLPEGTTPNSAPNGCDLNGNELTCNVGTLPAGDSVTKTVTVTADDPVPASVLAAGEVINTATVTSENSNCPPDSDNPDCITTHIVEITPSANLVIQKSSSAASVKPGESFDWSITATNNGQGIAKNVVIVDTLPDGTTPDAAPNGCTITGNEFTCEVGDLASSEAITKTVTVTVDDPVPAEVLAAGEVINTAKVTSENSNCPPNSDDPSCITTNIVEITPSADLTIQKTSSASAVKPGESFDWTITVTNNGQDDSTNVVITDIFPDGTTPGATAPNGCDFNGNELTCEVGTLASGDSFTVTITVTADDPVPAAVLAAGEVVNTAYVTDDGENCPEDDPCSSTSIVEITPLADLDIQKTSSAPSASPGESFDWSITVTNNGQGDDTGVVITDTLPDGTTPGAAPEGCILDGNDLTCDIGDLPAGDSVTKTITVTVDDPVPAAVLAAGEVVNTAHVTDENGNCPENNPCSSTSIVDIIPMPNLTIVKASSAPSVAPGESFDWTVTVTNNGQGDAVNTVITDTLPDGTTPGVAPDGCTIDGNELTCSVGDLPAGDSVTKTITVTVDDPVPAAVLAAGEVVNTAYVTDDDSCPPDTENPNCSSTSIVEIPPTPETPPTAAPPTVPTPSEPPVATTPPVTTPPKTELPRTGSPILPMVLLGGSLLLLGAGVEIVTRRRRNRV